MPYLVGVDEAGYGPNLGPLLISASVWRVDRPPADLDLYAVLHEGVTRQIDATAAHPRLVVADSKLLYRPGAGIDTLEEHFLAALHRRPEPATWRGVWSMLAPESAGALTASPWYADYDCPVPRKADASRIDDLRRNFRRCQRLAGVALLQVRSHAVFPEQFNAAVEQWGNKAAALSQITLQLVRGLLEQLPAEPTLVHCDKHGGRNRYGPLLQQVFPDDLVQVRRESAAISQYHWGPPARRVHVRFVAKGESFLPAALASMACKYLRELAMEAFNAFWTRQVADLKPTAGYPVDARRFKQQIQATQERLGISDGALWRSR